MEDVDRFMEDLENQQMEGGESKTLTDEAEPSIEVIDDE